jgi:hypothetical protein
MKLSLEALKERAEAIASEELLNEISGGLANSCHNQCHGTECYNQLLKQPI